MNPFARTFCLFLVLVTSIPLSAQDTALRANLDRAYNQWREAVLTQDPKAWAAAITQYRQVVTRNMVVSQRKSFPKAVFEVPLDPPDITGLRLLEAQAVGDTAHTLYFGKISMGGDAAQIPEAVLMLKFFNERGAWRFDSSKLLKLVDQPELVQQMKSGGKLEFLDYPEFTPPGKAPTVPPLCDVPEYVAGCTLQSYGHETKMRINGFDYPAMADHGEKIFVIGGLKSGANEVTLTVKPTDIPKGEPRTLQVDFFVLTGNPDKPPVRVFHYENKEDAVASPIKLPVIIDADVLSKGR